MRYSFSMQIKDIKEETRIKISFPDETEIEDDIQRIMLSTHSLMEYLLDIGMDPTEMYRTVMYMGLNRFFNSQQDIEVARQEAQIYLDEALNNEIIERKKVQESSGEHPDFFSTFINPKLPPTHQ
jgi:hypothetical protein